MSKPCSAWKKSYRFSLNESMALFEEGTKLSAYLSQLLDTAEQKVTMITVRDGAETEIPFDTQEGE